MLRMPTVVQKNNFLVLLLLSPDTIQNTFSTKVGLLYSIFFLRHKSKVFVHPIPSSFKPSKRLRSFGGAKKCMYP